MEDGKKMEILNRLNWFGSECSWKLYFFNLYINDLVSAIKTVKGEGCLLFADDLVIWTQAPKRNAKSLIEKKINKALDILSDLVH
ncbi:hypothetical protein CEXT_453761 [Caerostris extrusa]|uniref:Reverse transcriptase domain-containing protein n=1 Tax=Caerostris extrusa TaxID=172846 RepID=A0AAV4TEM0_CAEEX|nr:hypothetical protein CEXT_453761 [Caerostris extrusa]